MALVFADPASKLELAAMRCSSCREVKSVEQFPASCAYWRRGACKGCRKSKAELAKSDAVLKKLDAARHRYKSARGISRADAAALLAGLGVDTSNNAEVARWRLVAVNADQPFAKGNMAWTRSVPPVPLSKTFEEL